MMQTEIYSAHERSNAHDVHSELVEPETKGQNRLTQPGLELRFEHLNLSIKGKKIVRDVSGCAKPGQVFAVMGPSGSGKTTLLNIIGGRVRANGGKATIGGQTLNKKTRRKISYVLQEDIFFPNLTLKQTLMFSAELRLSESWPRKMKEEIVQEIVEELEMKNCMKTIIGNTMNRGLSGGEKKRANIANELLTDPAVLLLDEPTSGLDSATAYGLVRTMKRYAVKTNKTVLMTIHQPSAQMFFLFDTVLLLSQGKVAYYGSPEDVLEHFANIGHSCDVIHYNPADFILDMAKLEGDELDSVISECSRKRSSDPDCPILQSTLTGKENDIPVVKSILYEETETAMKNDTILGIRSNDESKAMLLVEDTLKQHEETRNGKSKGNDVMSNRKSEGECVIGDGVRPNSPETSSVDSDELVSVKKHRAWSTSFKKQVTVLTERSFIQGKSRYISKIKFAKCIGSAIIAGLIWWQTGAGHPPEDKISDITAMFFFITLYCSFDPLFDVLRIFPSERTVINKERMAGTYRLSAYYLAKLLSELPLTLMLPAIFTTILYWMGGLNGMNDPLMFFAAFGTILAQALASQSIGLFVSAATMDFDHALVMAVLLMISFMLLGGFYVKNIPSWLSWMKYLSPITHAWGLALQTEFNSDERILCDPILSAYQSCKDQANATSSTYDVSNTTNAMMTQQNVTHYVSFQEILAKNNITDPVWLSIVCLLGIMVFFRTLGYVCLRLFHKPAMK